MANNDDEDEGFGDFTFAPSNHILQSKPAMSNLTTAAAAADDDDDWGDFVNSGELSHTLSLPKVSKSSDPFGFSTDQKLNNNNSDPVQPDSAPARFNPKNSSNLWEKPKGALPLSIFGEEEEEENGSGGDEPLEVNGVAEVVTSSNNVVNVNNLINDLYKKNDIGNGLVSDSNGSVSNLYRSNSGSVWGAVDSNGSNLAVNDSRDLRKSEIGNGVASDLNWGVVNQNDIGLVVNDNKDSKFDRNGISLNQTKDSKFDWNGVNLNPNATLFNENSSDSVAKEVPLGGNNGVSSVGVNFQWNVVNSNPNPNVSKSNDNEFGSVAKEGHIGTNGGDFDWNAVNLNPNASKFNENELSSVAKDMGTNGGDFDWNPVNLNPNASKFTENQSSSAVKDGYMGSNEGDARVVDTNKRAENDGDEYENDGWEFMAAESKASIGVENLENSNNQNNSALNQFNVPSSSWNMLISDFSGWNSNATVQNSSTDCFNKNVPDPKGQVGDDGSKDSQMMTEKLSNSTSNGFHSSWGALHSGFDSVGSNLSGANSEGNQNSNLMNGDSSFNDADAWGFKSAAPNIEIRDGSSKDNQSNTIQADHKKAESGTKIDIHMVNKSWDESNVGGDWLNSNLTGVSSQTTQLNTLDENEDYGSDDGWEFKAATETESKVEDAKDGGQHDSSVSLDEFNFSNGGNGHSGFFGASQNDKFGEWEAEFDFKPSSSIQKDTISDPFFRSQQIPTENKLHFSSVARDSDNNSWAFKDPFSESGSKNKEEPKVTEVSPAQEAFASDSEFQASNVSSDKNKGALSLSIFGEEEQEYNDPVIYEDTEVQKPTFNSIVVTKSTQSVSINDLISSLYSQAEQNTPVSHAQISSENRPEITDGTTDSNLVNDDNYFDDNSWDFQDAYAGARAEDQTSSLGTGETHTQESSKIEAADYVDFFSKMMEELQPIALSHIKDLKKAQSDASSSGNDERKKAIDEDIQDLNNVLLQDVVVYSRASSEESSISTNMNFGKFTEALQESKFQILESAYHLSKKLSLVESDVRTAIELLKHVALILKILRLVSSEDQSSYVSTWSKMLLVCSQELKHGISIWKQLFEKDAHHQILSTPQGKINIIALGEIYRTVQVLGASMRIYAPWLLASSADAAHILTLLSECSTIWSSSGLEEAILNIPDLAGIEYDNSVKMLIESIKHIRDIDALSLCNHVLSAQNSTCMLSGLTSGTVPGLKTVFWNGKYYFLLLANLWVNLISCDLPNLPPIHIEGQ